MTTDMFSPESILRQSGVTEENKSRFKEETHLYPTDKCDDIFEMLQGRLTRSNIEDNDIFKRLGKCNYELKNVNILGEYISSQKKIYYYPCPMEYEEITAIHERFHAVHHLTEDKDGNIWVNFESVSSFKKELLAQLFTYIYICKNFNSLLKNFLDLNDTQPFIYQTFRIFMNYDEFEAENLYWIIRDNKDCSVLRMVKKLERITGKKSKVLMNNTSLKSKIDERLADILEYICKNPLLYVSETDIHQIVCNDLMSIEELNPKINLYNTGCTIGLARKGKTSAKKYKTTLIHKEYGHDKLPKSRSDIVIFDKKDVSAITDPINLKIGNAWLTPEYIFEFGTEKSAGSAKAFKSHILNDLKKITKAKQCGYLIHIHRNYIKSVGKRAKQNKNKFNDYIKAWKEVIDKYRIKSNNIKVIIIRIDIGSEKRIIKKEGKIKIVLKPFWKDCRLDPINLNKIKNEICNLLA